MIPWTQVIFQEVYPNQELKIETELPKVGALLSKVGHLCWTHHFQGPLTQSLSPGLDSVNLECWPSSFGQSVDFSFVDSRLWLLVVVSWLSLRSFLSLYPFLPVLLKERLSLFVFQMLSTAGLMPPGFLRASPDPCMGKKRSRHPLNSPNNILTSKM